VTGPLRSALIGAGCGVHLGPTDNPTPGAADVARAEAATSLGILVADHDDPVVAGFSEAWRAAGVPSLVIVQHHPEVRIGPFDVPGTALCAHCFRTRARQNGRGAKACGDRLPDRGPAISVDGYPPYLIAVAVALTMERLTALDDAAEARNEITVVNTATLVTRTFTVVPVNQCPQCDDQKPIGLLAGHQPMFPDLERVPR